MKLEQSELPLRAHIRYAVDQEIAKANPVRELLDHAKTRPSGLPPVSGISTSHLAALSLTKEASYSWTSFFPPPNLNPDLAFSSRFFSFLEKTRRKFSSFIAEKKEENYKGEFPLKEFFSVIGDLHKMYKIIESQRNGVKQG